MSSRDDAPQHLRREYFGDVTQTFTVYNQKSDILECNSFHDANQYAKYIR